MEQKNKPIHSEFQSLHSKRESYEQVWDVSAEYTLREMYLPDELRDTMFHDPSDMVEGDSIGADALNNFISVIQRTAFSPNEPFCIPQPITGSELDSLPPEQKMLICLKAGQQILQKLNKRGLSVALPYMIGRFVGLGNAVWTQPTDKDGRIEVYELNDVVVHRDNRGRLIKIITKDCMPYAQLPDNFKQELGNNLKKRETVNLYTMTYYDAESNKYSVRQAVEQFEMPVEDNFFSLEKSEIQVGSLYMSRGRSYGMGVVYRYLKWLHAANIFSDAKNDVAALGSMINWGLSPSSAVRPEDWANRKQGEGFSMREGEVFPIVPDVGQQMNFAASSYSEVERRIQRAFLMFSAVQRDAERVTAAEIRAVMRSLEDAHSGLYSQLAEELQRPLAHYGLSLIDDEEIKPFVKDMQINLVAADEALGQNADLTNLMSALNGLTVMNNIPPDVMQTLRRTSIFQTIFAANNVDPENYIKSEEELQAEQQAMAQAEQQQQAPVRQSQQFTPNDELADLLNGSLL